MINILTAPRAWLKEINRSRAARELRPSMLATRSQRSACTTLCGQCGDRLIAPEWSAYVTYGREAEGHVRHLWCCSNCGYQFETFLSFATSVEFQTELSEQISKSLLVGAETTSQFTQISRSQFRPWVMS